MMAQQADQYHLEDPPPRQLPRCVAMAALVGLINAARTGRQYLAL